MMTDVVQERDHRAKLEEIRRNLVSEKVGSDFAEQNTQYGRLLNAMTKAALQYALQQGMNEFEFVNGPLSETFVNGPLSDAANVTADARWSVCDVLSLEEGEKRPLNFWRHHEDPLEWIRQKKVPYIDRSEVEICVGSYLRLPFRCEAMDRLLVDLLVATEMYGFGDKILNEETFGLYPHSSPLKQRHVLLTYIGGVVIGAAILVGAATLALYLGSNGWIGEGWSVSIAAVLVLIWLVLLAIQTTALPIAWVKQRKARQRVANLLGRMFTIYAGLDSSGPISEKHIRGRVDAAAAEGVVWPAPLFVLLEDIASRSGRF